MLHGRRQRVPIEQVRPAWCRSVPDHGGVDHEEAFDRLCRRVYAGARAGAPDPTDTFDLAAAVLDVRPADQAATELASLSVDGVPASRPRMVELSDTLLGVVCSELGLSEEPGRLVRLDDAMRLVNQDLAASGLRSCRLRFMDSDPRLEFNRHAESWDGNFGTSSGVPSHAGADAVSALVAVAEDVQDAVMHTIWTAWPVCPVHRLGTHAREHHGTAVWWCTGDGGHAAAAIGEWQGH
jgi:hypothetical protein